MPQFDKVTFLTQIHWLLVVFFFLYYILLIYTPNLILLLKLRKKRLKLYETLCDNAKNLNELNQGSFSLLINNISNFSKNIISKNNVALNLWTNNYISNVFNENIKVFLLNTYNTFLSSKNIIINNYTK